MISDSCAGTGAEAVYLLQMICSFFQQLAREHFLPAQSRTGALATGDGFASKRSNWAWAVPDFRDCSPWISLIKMADWRFSWCLGNLPALQLSGKTGERPDLSAHPRQAQIFTRPSQSPL